MEIVKNTRRVPSKSIFESLAVNFNVQSNRYQIRRSWPASSKFQINIYMYFTKKKETQKRRRKKRWHTSWTWRGLWRKTTPVLSFEFSDKLTKISGYQLKHCSKCSKCSQVFTLLFLLFSPHFTTYCLFIFFYTLGFYFDSIILLPIKCRF